MLLSRILALPLSIVFMASAHAAPIAVVAAENVYGGIAAEIGADNVAVTSILSNPDQDPHLFEVSPSAAKAISGARIVVLNGAGYDPWMKKLLSSTKAKGPTLIDVAELVNRKPGDNPHLWYDIAAVKAFAASFERILAAADPAHEGDYSGRLAAFDGKVAAIAAKVEAMRVKYAGAPVAATEPVFGYMADAIGLEMRNRDFQTAIMNDTEPSISQVAAFESDLKQKKVKALIYNSQVTEPATERLLAMARANGVATVGVTETEPAATSYAQWMIAQLDALDAALGGARQ